MKVGKKTATGAKGLVPVIVKWKIKDGHILDHTKEQKTIRALAKALGSLVPKKGEEMGGFQHFVTGPNIYLESCSETKTGKEASYRAVGRAEIGKTHMKTDAFSQDIFSFDLVFKDTKDAHGLPELEIVSGDINPLPRGTSLTP